MTIKLTHRLALLLICVFYFSSTALAFEEPKLISVTKPSGGETHTVCPSGCDFTSLGAADGNVSAGDTLRVKAGNYSSFSWGQNGSSGSEIVIEAYGDGDVTFTSSGGGRTEIQGNYIIFDGGPDEQLIFKGVSKSDGPVLYLKGDHITVWRCEIKNQQYHEGAIIVKGNSNRIYNCYIHTSVGEGIYLRNGDHHEIKGCRIHDCLSGAIQFNPHGDGENIDDAEIAYNAVYDNGYDPDPGEKRGGIAVYLSNRAGHTLSNVYIYNNLSWGNARSGIGIRRDGGTMTNIFVYNNSTRANGEGGIYPITANIVTARNNICVDGMLGSYLASSNNLTTNPSFVSTNEAEDNFLKLSSGSNAIDQGADISSEGVTDDYLGNPRPKYGGYDIGAYEYMVEAPENLRIKSID